MSGSHNVKVLAWYGRNHRAAIESYELFCTLLGLEMWPATATTLEEWPARRILGTTVDKQGRITANTLQDYLSGLSPYHVDRHLPTDFYEGNRLSWVLR